MQHIAQCPQSAFGHSDAAKRLSDHYNIHRIAGGLDAVRKWFAVRLDDGQSDGVLYDSKSDCVKHQHHNESFYAFIRIAPCDMKVCDAEIVLRKNRQFYDNGLRMADPDQKSGGSDVITRLTYEDELAAMRGKTSNLIFPWELN